MFLEILIGILAAVIIVFFSSSWHPRKQLKLWSNSLMIAALIYIGFACYHLAWDSLPQEILGVIGYGALAVLGDKYNPIFLILGWSLHVLWDIILHSPSSIAPESYPGLCLGFDLAVALYLIYWVFKNHDADKTQSAFKS